MTDPAVREPTPRPSSGRTRLGSYAIGIDTDVRDWSQVQAMAQRAIEHFGQVDILVKEGTIDQADLDRFIITDSPQQAVESITKIAKHAFGLTYGSRMRRRWFLGERQHRSSAAP